MEQTTEQRSQAEPNPARLPKMERVPFSVVGKSGRHGASREYKKAGKRKMDEMTGGEIFRLIQYLRSQGWTDEKSLNLSNL